MRTGTEPVGVQWVGPAIPTVELSYEHDQPVGGGLDGGGQGCDFVADGFKARLVRLGLVLEGGYNTNVFLSDDGLKWAQGYLRVLPQLTLTNRRAKPPPRVEYELGLLVDYYMHPDQPGTSDAHRVGVRADAGVIHRRKVVRLHLWDRVTRTSEHIVGFEPWMGGAPDRLHNVAEVGVTVSPAKSRFSFHAAYRHTLELFEGFGYRMTYRYVNRMRHDVTVGVRRRFRKWLTFGLSAETGYLDYLREYNPDGPGGGVMSNRAEVRVQLIADVRLGRSVRLRAAMGYGGAYLEHGFASDGIRYHELVGEVGGRFALTADTYVWAGFWHDFRSPFAGEQLSVSAAVLRLHVAMLHRLELDVTTAWTFARHGGFYLRDVVGFSCSAWDGTSACGRRDQYLQLSAQATGHLLPWLAASLGYVLQVGASNLDGAVIFGGPISVNFLRHRAFGRLSVHY